MNTYKKFCANVFVAQCEKEYNKGDIITLVTKRGKENEHIVHNLVGRKDQYFYYSITRVDGYNLQERAKKKAEAHNRYSNNAEARAQGWSKAAEEGKDFLALGEPIKIGHHSEKRHRALIERNHNRLDNMVKEYDKAKCHKEKARNWETKTEDINLSIPESLEYYRKELEAAKQYHIDLKTGVAPREHSYSLTYAKKKVNDLEKKVKLAERLWK